MAQNDTVRGITPKGVAIYPRVNKADTKFNPEGMFSTRLRLSAEDAQPLMDKISEMVKVKAEEVKKELIAAKKAGQAKNLKFADLPYKEEYDEAGNETGNVIFNFKQKAIIHKKDGTESKMKIDLVDAKGKPTAVEPWSGSEIKVAYEFAPFYTAIGVGVSARLRAVQIIKLVTGGSRDYGFGVEEGGFEDEGNTGAFTDAGADEAPAGDNPDF